MTRLLSRIAAALLVAATVTTGCDVSIDVPEITARYTLWGALDPSADVQLLRVVAVTDTVSAGSLAPLGATVRSVDLVTGAEATWADTTIVFEDSTVGHVYRAAFRPAFGSRHLVTVTAPDGAETTALVAIPAATEPVLDVPTVSGGATYTAFWPGTPRLNAVRLTYVLSDGNCNVYSHTRDFDGLVEPGEFGWTTTFSLRDESGPVRAAFSGAALTVRRITLSGEVASEDWRPPGGVFDPDVLIEPGVLSNVTGGFGFVGGAYRTSVEWVPTAIELRTTGFESPGLGNCATGRLAGR